MIDIPKGTPVSPLTLIYLRDGDKILTLKRASNKKIFPNKWSGFGGKVEPGEDLIESARREFLEETGLTVDRLKLKGTFTRFIHGYLNVLYIFVATGYHGEIRSDPDEGEIAWRNIKDFLADPDLVDHAHFYVPQIFDDPGDFYCGFASEDLSEYFDNKSHFDLRRKAS
jgi:8-oxo-dGTP diphosphatase